MLVRLANVIECTGMLIADMLIDFSYWLKCKRVNAIFKASEILFDWSMRLFGMAGGK